MDIKEKIKNRKKLTIEEFQLIENDNTQYDDIYLVVDKDFTLDTSLDVETLKILFHQNVKFTCKTFSPERLVLSTDVPKDITVECQFDESPMFVRFEIIDVVLKGDDFMTLAFLHADLKECDIKSCSRIEWGNIGMHDILKKAGSLTLKLDDHLVIDDQTFPCLDYLNLDLSAMRKRGQISVEHSKLQTLILNTDKKNPFEIELNLKNVLELEQLSSNEKSHTIYTKDPATRDILDKYKLNCVFLEKSLFSDM